MKITLTPRTPLHIGTGLVYHPNEYIHGRASGEKRFIWRIDCASLARSFTVKQRDEFIQRMDDAASGLSFSLTEFIRNQELKPLPFRLYRLDNATGEPEPKEIREYIKTAGIPYIPGSSLKGAIRTALLWSHARKDAALIPSIRKELERKSSRRDIGNAYVSSVFSLRQGGSGKFDPKDDLLRFLQVSDCMPEDFTLFAESIQTFSLRQRMLARKEYSIFAECVKGTFQGSIGGLDQISRMADTPHFPLLMQKISLLGMQNPGDTGRVPAHLAKILTEWSRWCLERERIIVEEGRAEQYLKVLEKVNSWLREGAHVRLGFGVGTLYQTLIGLIEEKEPDLAVEIINRNRLGKFPRQAIHDGIEPPYPKSVEFTRTGEPMGWVSLKME